MSLNFSLYVKDREVFSQSITHNLNEMGKVIGVYYQLWRPEEVGIKKAKHIVPILEQALENMIDHREFYEKFNPENGWGNFGNLFEFINSVHIACIMYPEAKIVVSR